MTYTGIAFLNFFPFRLSGVAGKSKSSVSEFLPPRHKKDRNFDQIADEIENGYKGWVLI